MIDFTLYRQDQQTIAQLAAPLTRNDLIALSHEMVDTQLRLIAEATDADVVFVPEDPDANDDFAATAGEVNLAWTLGHVIVHTTASSEEYAMRSLSLARGVVLEPRSRYETTWETVSTIAQCRARLNESRRMRLAMLDAWPDQPHLDLTHVYSVRRGPVNAISVFLMGLSHDDSHLKQIENIVAQARRTRMKA